MTKQQQEEASAWLWTVSRRVEAYRNDNDPAAVALRAELLERAYGGERK